MTHIIPAFVIQLLLSPIDWWFGALFASGYYLGREMAQAEYRVIQKFYDGRRSKMPWYGAFEPRGWDRKSMLDWILPTTVTIAIATYTVYN
jgi:hypothetical protein